MKQRVFRLMLSVAVAILPGGAVALPLRSLPRQAVVVTSTADSGAGTLREALEQATSGTVISFDPTLFPPHNAATIALRSPLPKLAQGRVKIDGASAGVILDGGALHWGQGFHVTSTET